MHRYLYDNNNDKFIVIYLFLIKPKNYLLQVVWYTVEKKALVLACGKGYNICNWKNFELFLVSINI